MSQNKTFGLVGFPVKHSLSPKMHNAAFSRLKIKAKYRLFPLQERQLKSFLSGLKKRNIFGLNVTIPHKERVLEFIDGYVSEGVRVIGACNTIVVGVDGKLKAYNTDYLGFLRHIRELKLKPKKIAIIGSGGAAKSVVFALIKSGAEEIYIFDIDKFRSLSLVKRFSDIFPQCKIRAVASIEELNLRDRDLLVNASPVGMKEADPLLVEPAKLHKALFVYDLVYNPSETKQLKAAKDAGCGQANGLGMLLYQGVEAFELWVKPKKAPVEAMRQALAKGVRRS